MSTPIEIHFNIIDVEHIRIKLNGQEYKLVPVNNNTPTTPRNDAPTLNAFGEQLIRKLRQEGRLRTSETYRCTLNSFAAFHTKDDISFSEIDEQLIEDYEQFMKDKGLSSNSSSFYLRVLRTIYNKAVACNYAIDQKPFRRVYTGIGKTVKRAIPLDAIRRISQLSDLTNSESLARDMFLFSFYTRGMSFIDMAYLKPQNLQEGILSYKRHKTGQKLTIRWEPQMQDIIRRHPSPNKDYLLPIIKRSNGHERCQYREAQRLINGVLKSVGKKANIDTPLTMYVARHSWASIARSMNIPVNIISEGMGHDSEKTTQIYLKSLNNKELNNANANIIEAVNNLSY